MTKRPLALLLLTLAGGQPALAHVGAGPVDGFAAGFLHPFGGPDHLLVMLAVGLWAVMLGGRAVWLAPSGFLLLMTLGAVAQSLGAVLPGAETGVSLSVLLMGLALWRQWRAGPVAGAAFAGVFAVFHGYVHAAELTAGTALPGYFAGFLLATALLHLCGILGGLACRRAPLLERGFGLVCAGTGILLLAHV